MQIKVILQIIIFYQNKCTILGARRTFYEFIEDEEICEDLVRFALENVNQGNPLNNYSLPKQLYNFSSQRNSLWVYSCMQTQFALVTVPWELCE